MELIDAIYNGIAINEAFSGVTISDMGALSLAMQFHLIQVQHSTFRES